MATITSTSEHEKTAAGKAMAKPRSSRERKAAAVKEAAAKQPVLVFGPNLGRSTPQDFSTTFHVMAPTDRKKTTKLYKGHTPMTVEASSVQQLVEQVYADQMAESKEPWTTYEPDFTFLASAWPILGIKEKPKPAARPTSTQRNRTAAWADRNGKEIAPGAKVECPGGFKGIAKARCTKPATKDQPAVPMIGVLLADPVKYQTAMKSARLVKVPTWPSTDLMLVKS
jgi:hypothetical protein